MASSAESDLLTAYLLQPAPLTAIITYEQFRSLFPRAVSVSSSSSSQLLRSLFRDLQAQRGAALDTVAASIEVESRRGGAAMRREVLRQRGEERREEGDGEVEMERALFANESSAKKSKHTLDSVMPELEGAAGALQAEIARLEEQEAELTESITAIVGGLSDLRHGKLKNPGLREDVLDGLTTLQEACDRKS